MTIREDCKYTKTHQWMREENDVVLVGITDYAQSQLGGIVFVNLPEVEDAFVLPAAKKQVLFQSEIPVGIAAIRLDIGKPHAWRVSRYAAYSSAVRSSAVSVTFSTRMSHAP